MGPEKQQALWQNGYVYREVAWEGTRFPHTVIPPHRYTTLMSRCYSLDYSSFAVEQPAGCVTALKWRLTRSSLYLIIGRYSLPPDPNRDKYNLQTHIDCDSPARYGKH